MLFTAHVASQNKVNHSRKPVVPCLPCVLNGVKNIVTPVRPDNFAAQCYSSDLVSQQIRCYLVRPELLIYLSLKFLYKGCPCLHVNNASVPFRDVFWLIDVVSVFKSSTFSVMARLTGCVTLCSTPACSSTLENTTLKIRT